MKDKTLNILLIIATIVCYISFSSWALVQLFAFGDYTPDIYKYYRLREDSPVITYILKGGEQ